VTLMVLPPVVMLPPKACQPKSGWLMMYVAEL
jgi:hypothetical protein